MTTADRYCSVELVMVDKRLVGEGGNKNMTVSYKLHRRPTTCSPGMSGCASRWSGDAANGDGREGENHLRCRSSRPFRWMRRQSVKADDVDAEIESATTAAQLTLVLTS